MPQYGDKVNMFEDNKIVTASELSFVQRVNADVFYCGAVVDQSVVIPLGGDSIQDLF